MRRALFVAGQDVPLADDEKECGGAHAAVVSPPAEPRHREPGLDDPAADELAGDLDSAERRAALAAAIERLDADAPRCSDSRSQDGLAGIRLRSSRRRAR